MEEAILGVDVGTSSLKAGLFTQAGQALAFAKATYSLSSPEPDAMEQDPDDWSRAFVAVCRELLGSVRERGQVAAVAIGGQAPTLCAVDANLHPTSAAISWLDQRPGPDAEAMYAGLGRDVPVWGSWPAQAAWFARNRPEAMRRTRWLFGCPEYVVAHLTGTPAALLEWPDDEIEAAGIDSRMLPPLHEPGQVVGEITPAVAGATGLLAGTRVVAGFVDGIMGVLGSGIGHIGQASLNGGTSGTFSVVSPAGLGYPVMGLHVAGAATNTSGKALDWFAQRFATSISSYTELLEEAATVEAGAGGLLFLPHLAGERAVRDSRSRGAWAGLTLEHDRRHLLRSVLEGVAFSFRAMRDSLAQAGAATREVRVVGGQARSGLWNQIKADVLNQPVGVPEVVEAPVVGAAILGAIGLQAYAGREEAVSAMVRIAREVEPRPAVVALYDELYEAYTKLYPAVHDLNWYLHDVATRSGA